jgi:phenylalanine-4-hydroxylase
MVPYNLKTMPADLAQYVVEQDYELYTPIDQEAWRFIMRLNADYLAKRAHPIYLKGLQETGIPIDRIPKISEMDECLQKFGWRAVAVSGFIPPAVFLELQASGILAIACDMRTLEHLAYTPAPDIVHEAAGHAPIIANEAYRKYLYSYGQAARRAIFSKEDMEVYEAVRHLSIVKEDPHSSSKDVAQAQERLDQATAKVFYLSEATELGRLAWWSTEYGLIGNGDSPLIFGAGLLSSVGESFNILNSNVQKIPYTKDCKNVGFDITRQQPQLFVVSDFQEMTDVLVEMSKEMAFQKGGLEGLAKAKMARTVTTTVLDSGLQISSILKDLKSDVHLNQEERLFYLQFEGPTQLSFLDQEISEHGANTHPHGFGTPLGKAKRPQGPSLPLLDWSASDFVASGFVGDKPGKIEFESKVILQGVLKATTQKKGKNIILHFDQCTVKRGDLVLFDPSWGSFDCACGSAVVSVFGGAADRGKYFKDVFQAQAQKAQKQKSNLTPQNEALNERFRVVRQIRESEIWNKEIESQLQVVFDWVRKNAERDWLLLMNVLEIVCRFASRSNFEKQVHEALSAQKSVQSSENQMLIERGLQLLVDRGIGA